MIWNVRDTHSEQPKKKKKKLCRSQKFRSHLFFLIFIQYLIIKNNNNVEGIDVWGEWMCKIKDKHCVFIYKYNNRKSPVLLNENIHWLSIAIVFLPNRLLDYFYAPLCSTTHIQIFYFYFSVDFNFMIFVLNSFIAINSILYSSFTMALY